MNSTIGNIFQKRKKETKRRTDTNYYFNAKNKNESELNPNQVERRRRHTASRPATKEGNVWDRDRGLGRTE